MFIFFILSHSSLIFAQPMLEFKLNILVSNSSSWSKEQVDLVVHRADEVLRQCDISLTSSFAFTDDLSSSVEINKLYNVFKLNDQTHIKYNVFLIDKILNFTGAAICTRGIVVSSFVNSDEYKNLRDPSYSVLAHEIGHFLGLKHQEWPVHNLMGDWTNSVNGQLTQPQCDLMRKNINKSSY